MREDERSERLLRILAEVIPGEEPTLDLALREQGLESLALTRVWFRLRKEFGVDVPVSWLRRCATPAELLARIEAEQGGATTAPVAADPATRYEPFPLTDLQQAYLVAKDPQSGGDTIGCHVYREFELDDVDVAALEAAWHRVVRHHDMLRAVITPDGRQRVQEHVDPPPLAVADMADAPAVRRRLSHRRYEPGEWPMHTVEVSRDPAGGRAVVHLSIDVLLIDGHGLGVILDDWWHCYRNAGHRLAAPELTVRDCVLDLAAQRRTPEYRTHLDHWTGHLADLPDGPSVGAAADGPAVRSALTARVDREQWQAVGRLAAQWEVSPTALVLTLFAETFGRQRDARPLSLVLTTSHRSRLPAESDDLVGPFTSSLVLPLPSTLDRPLRDAVQEVHQRLWEGLDHSLVSGVAALRALRARDRTAPAPSLPVVFTSMLGTGRAGADGFAGSVGYAVSQTTGVALDHQMWERDGELHVRWDAVPERFAPGELDDLFAGFVNSLLTLTDRPSVHRPMNGLQQAYFVPRIATLPGEWDGCQVYHSFEVDEIDPERLESAWSRLVAAYEPLRTVVTHDGRLAVSPHVSARRMIPVLDLSTVDDPEACLAALRTRMAGRAFPLGRGPQSDLRVTLHPGGPATVHLTTDLTLLDGRSIHFVVRELWRLYADEAAVPPPCASYADWAADRKRLGDGPQFASWTEHWRERIAGLHPGPQLPAAGSERSRLRLEGRLTGWRSVKERAERAGVGPDELLAAACTGALAADFPVPFSLPVVRWTEDSARYRPGEYTALSWVTRQDAALGPWEQAAEFRRVLDEDRAADAVGGLGELRRRVMRERRAGAFDLPVVYTGVLDLSAQQLPDGVRLGPWLTCTPDVALDCIAIDEGDELRFYWDADPSRFAPGRLEAMFALYRQTLEGLSADPARWNDTETEFRADRQVHRLFEEQAAAHPDAVAVRWAGGRRTYGELNRWANRIAWALRERGVGPGTPVGISVRRGPAMVAAVHGVLKAGGFYVPLEPSLPAARAETILRDAGTGVLLSDEERTGWSVPDGVRVVPVEAAGLPEHDPEPVGSVDDLAYVIFTSGSTGTPKGVEVTHRPLLNLLNWCARTHGFGPQDVGLCVTSLGFDLSVFDILGLLAYGACVYVADEAEQRDPHLLLDVLLREPVTFWNSAPTTLNQLAPLFPGSAGRPGTDTLRLVYLSGDYTPLPLPDEVRGLFPHARIVSLGGATEATVWSNWFEIGTVDPAWRSIPYGSPIDNARYYILDERLRPCPVGVEGDLYIGGECLSLGYHRRPDLTGERFVPDPFSDRDGARMYRTGDRASRFPDGVISFHGRTDSQVKVRGFRVELAEVEHRLRGHAGVKDVVVLARPDRTGDRRLVAYVVPVGDPAEAPAASALRRHAAQALPDYMVPNVVAFVDTFPATPNGKLDREALPWPVEPDSFHTTAAAPVGGPGGPAAEEGLPDGPSAREPRPDGTGPDGSRPDGARVEELAGEIAGIFAELLGLPEIGVTDDIWDRGATSFTVVQVSGVLQQRHGLRVPVSALLNDPTVAGIAAAVAELSADPGTEEREARDAGTGAESGVMARPEGEGRTQTAADAPAPAEPGSSAGSEASTPARADKSDPAPGEADTTAGPGAGAHARPVEVDFFSASEREAFKAARRDLRQPAQGAPVLPLDGEDVAEEHFSWRASRREFGAGPVPHRAFVRLLGLLRESRIGDRNRRLYPSAGDTYSVQVYVHVRPGGVEGVPAGLYYHHPVQHALHLVDAEPGLDRSMHFVYNRPVFDGAGFELYLFGADVAIEPLYGTDTERFQLLEAGYLGQLLLLAQPFTGVGLCPVGTLALDAVRDRLGLGERHRYLHAFLGGPLAAPPPTATAGGERPLFVAAADTSPGVSDGDDGGRAELVVVGAAGRFPGADDLDTYWTNLSRGTRSLTGVPEGRAAQFPEDAPAGGYLTDVDSFDSLLFRVAPAEAASLDPQSRMLLHTVWECLDDAGHTPESLNSAGRVGVFLGAMWQDYQHVGADLAVSGASATISATASEAANRISHFFGFDGPSLAVDTSCSSSLSALHLAVESLHRGECDSAVVAAANLITHPYHLRLLADTGLLAERLPDGAFADGTGGWSPGEGVAAVLLRTGPNAERDGDTPIAVVEATRVGHLGGAGRFATPQAGPLARSIKGVLAVAGVGPGDVDYVECAAAGALLADAAELEALGEVFAGDGFGGRVAVGTVKPNIGHLEAAAGLSQLVKVLLQFRHGQLTPTVFSDRSGVSWPAGLRRADHLAFWPGTGRRRALVNAVGATGSYGHVLLRAWQPAESSEPNGSAADARRTSGPHPDQPGHRLAFPLSAQTDEQLVALAGLLQRRLESGQAPALEDLALTLQSGRRHLERRVVVEASTPQELLTRLREVGRGATRPVPSDADLAAWQSGADIDWSRHRPAGARRVPLPNLPFRLERHALEHTSNALTADPIGTGPALPAPRTGTPPVPRTLGDRDAVEYLKSVYSEVSGVPADRLDPHAPMERYGLSSAQVVRLTARLRADLGEDVPSTLFFAHRDLAGVAGELAGLRAPMPRPDADSPEAAGDRDGRIAVIGLAGRYPGAADVEEFWQHLLAGRDLIAPLPEGRRRDAGTGAETMTGGFLDDVAGFDPLFFGITPRDAAAMDPQERLFLQTAWHALEDAGYTRAKLRERHGGRVGVFVGSMYNEYPYFGLHGPRPVGSAIAGIANRVSYFLDLNGPSLTVDTMCSSSLTALHLAVAALRRGECEAVLVGGVNLSLHPNKFATLRELGMASSDHRCRSFGAGGDGFVPGEGVGAVLLRPLAQAVADGDRIHATVLGTAVNHDGKTNGYTVPNPVAQGRLVTQALKDAGVGPQDIGYVEAHGTGTALGDPIEIDGLGRAFASAAASCGPWPIGSVKSGIGHLEAAAGIAGLTKVVLQFRHDTLAPSLHAEDLNPHVDWARGPFRVQREAAPWPADAPRRAGISSFGAGGTNAHVVVEAPPAGPARETGRGPQLIVLSARTEEGLSRLAARWRQMLRGPHASLADLAYTAQLGREPMRERLAVVARDETHLAALLDRYLAGDASAVVRGRAGTTPGPQAGPGTTLDELARHWADGGAVDWGQLHPSARRLADLPGYPFASMRCWADAEVPALAEVPSGSAEEEGGARVPLLARDWRAEPFPEPGPEPSGRILCLLGDERQGLAEAFAPAELLTLRQGTDFTDVESAVATVRELLGRGPVTGVLDLCALAEGAEHEHDDGPWTARLAILQQLLAARPASGLRILQVTRGLQALSGAGPNPAGARLSGFVRSLGAEYPWARSTVLDTDRPQALAELTAAWRDSSPYGELVLRQGRRLRPVLVPVPSEESSWEPRPDRVYLVTGGTRGLGALTARHLARRGARRLAVLGLRPLPPRHEWARGELSGPEAEAVENIRELERLGAQVMTHTGALTGRAELAGFLSEVRTALGPIGGVVHCAGRGTAGPAPLVHKDIAGIRRVLEPKGDGLDTLLELTGPDPLDFVVLFSSVSAAVPALAAGVADYAAANARLDVVARHRSGVRAVNWPVWQQTGGATDRPDAAAGAGLAPLTDADALDVLDRVLGLPAATVLLPCPAQEGSFDAESVLHANRPPGEPAEAEPTTGPASDAGSAGEPEPWLVRLFAETLRIPEAELDHDVVFGDLGVESVMLAELTTRIEAQTGRPLEPAVLLDHPTLRRLAAHLAAEGPTGRDPEPAAVPAEVPVRDTSEPQPVPQAGAGAAQQPDGRIAVIGMACRFPGAPDVESFRRLLRDGGCAVTEVPTGRWDTDRLYRPERSAGYSISKWGGFVDGIEDFDPAFFGMSEAEARDLDPAIRLTMEAAAACLRDAGYGDEELRGGDVGVFMGARMSDYRRRIGLEGSATGLGGDQNFIAARVAHQYDFRGPALVVDSACSSALVSVQTAARSLLAGESVLALAGGVEVLLDEEPYLEFSVARALSPRGRCATFDKDADGFVPGEGCGVLLLKTLERAVRDGDRVHAVIDAVAVGNDGRTMGLTTPNPVAQAQVVRRALALAGVRPQEVGLVEAHGTGTLIGDPIELRALTEVFREQTDRTGFCAIGSVKSNIGHLLSAAGIAGLVKALLAVEHGEIAPTLFCETPNPRFDFASSPFTPATRLREWTGRRVAGVSAFGLGGTNAHAIVSEAPAGRPRRTPLPPPVFRRRRLWRERVAAPGAEAVALPLVSSLLDLDFRTDLSAHGKAGV
ncbi:amino acid adenylation domain-containing protein [Streptomyces sp. NPDC059862]|uniref:amino acid adenylation domain-containing protein n=1 Tax=Streptomyces sp. NPDC059862 TaxID=3346975 RepID=UPI00365E678A